MLEIRKRKFVKILYAIFEIDFIDAHISPQTFVLSHINLRQKQLTVPDCKNYSKLQTDFSGKVEDFQLCGSGWRYSRIESMHVFLSKLSDTGSTSCEPLSTNHRSIINKKKTENLLLAIRRILACLHPVRTNVSLTSSYRHNFNTVKTSDLKLRQWIG